CGRCGKLRSLQFSMASIPSEIARRSYAAGLICPVKSRPGAAAPTVFPSSSTSRTAPALNSSVKLRRVRFDCLSAIVDIVSAFRKGSAKPDQAHHAFSIPCERCRLPILNCVIRTLCPECCSPGKTTYESRQKLCLLHGHRGGTIPDCIPWVGPA